MNAANFVWCNKSLADIGMIIGGISGAEGTMTPASVSFTTATTPTSNTKKFVAYNYEQTLQFEFSIVKNPCENEDMYIDAELDRYIRKWLVREDGFHKIMFDAQGYETIYFNCYLNITPQYINGNIIGYTVMGVTDSPYPYGEDITYKFEVAPNKPFKLLMDSDVVEYVYPELYITPKNGGNFIFKVEEDSISTVFNDSFAGYPIYINGETSVTNGINPDQWNWMFPRLIQKYEETYNTITCTTPCEVVLKYKPRRKMIL